MRKSTLKWCEDNISLDGEPFRRERWPHVQDILDTLDNRRGCTFVIYGSIQSWKTLVAELYMLASIVLRPGRWAWYSQTGDTVKQFAEEKLNPLYDATQELRRVEPHDRHGRIKTLAKHFPHMTLGLLSAGTRGNRNSKTLSRIVTDEGWDYGDGELTEIRGRYTSYIQSEDWQHIIPSSGDTAGGPVDLLWQSSDQRLLSIRCVNTECPTPWHYPEIHPPDPVADRDPESGAVTMRQPPGGLHYESGPSVRDAQGRPIERLVAPTVYYECPHCGHRSPKLDFSTTERARYIASNPTPSRNVVAWKHNALAHLPLLNVAMLKLLAEDDLRTGDSTAYEDFERKRALRPWSPSRLIKQVNYATNAGSYRCEEPWGDQHAEFMIIDRQQDHYWYLIRKFARDARSRLTICGRVWGEAELRAIQLRHGIPDHGGNIMEHPETGQLYLPTGCGVFVDGNYNTPQTRRLAARYHWVVLRGEPSDRDYRHPDGKRRMWNPITAIEAFEGLGETAPDSSCDRYVAEVRFAKSTARNTLRTLQGITQPAPPWTYAADIEERCPDYLAHLRSWMPRDRRKSKESEQVVTEWIQVQPRDDLEWCECAAIVAASMSGIIGSSTAAPEEHAQ